MVYIKRNSATGLPIGKELYGRREWFRSTSNKIEAFLKVQNHNTYNTGVSHGGVLERTGEALSIAGKKEEKKGQLPSHERRGLCWPNIPPADPIKEGAL